MAGRHCFGPAQIASVGILVLIASWQVIEPKPLEPAPIERRLRSQNEQPNRAAASVDQIAAILSAKPRSTKPQTPKLDVLSDAKSIQRETRLVPSLELGRKSNKTQPNKRQTDLLDHSNGSQSGARSRRNEDPWFLDQAPLPLQPYRFVYNVKGNNGLTEQYRQEAGDGKFLTGSYGYVLPDGIYRHVDYVADDRGFRAFIRTSEPGTANENPADVVINSNPVPQQAGPSYTSGASLLSPSGGSGGGANLAAFSNATSSWNYSGTPAGYAPIDISRSSDGFSLARRPAGSIINTPLRNFNSLAYLQPPSPLPTLPNYSFSNFSNLPSAQLEPLPPLFESTRAPSLPASSFNLTQFQPTSWSSGSWNDRKPANDESSSGQISNRFAPSRSIDQPSWSSQSSFFGLAPDQSGNSATGNFGASKREQSQLLNQNEPSSPSSSVSRVELKLVSPTRAGPNLLLYDQPFVSYPRENARKIHYDSSYIFHPDSPFLSLERAKSIAQLDRFNAVSKELNYPRPLDSRHATGLLGSNEIRQPAPVTSPNSSATSKSHSEQHHELLSSRQFVDFFGKLSLTKEHKSGHLEANRGSDQLLLPPKPQFQSALSRRVNQMQSSADSGVKGQPRARLMAPYAGNLDQQQEQQLRDEFSGMKGSNSESQQQQQKSVDTSPRPPEETLVDRPQSDKDSEKSPGATKSSSDPTERQMDEIELSKTTTKSLGEQSKSTPTRTIRVPEEYRSSKMLMNDIRSMQNSIGLPQPPRLQRSSVLSSLEEASLPLDRVESPDRLNPTHASQAPNVPIRSFNKLHGAQLKNTQVVDGQTRGLDKSPLDRSANNNEELPSLASNETFEALRLSPNKAQNLSLEKLSELEKFQQRLRSQQKLLESIKSPIESPVKQISRPVTSRSLSETANSHVKYDEPSDYDSHNNAPANQSQRSPKPSDDQNGTSNTANGSAIDNKLLHVHRLDLRGGRSGDKEAHENEIKSDVEAKKTEPRSPNTINLDFINSVTALSVDHSNPFAITSVNPAVQRSSDRLSPHKLSLPVGSNSTANSMNVPASRLFSPSDSWLASIENRDRRGSSGLLGNALRIDAIGSPSLLLNNHRVSGGDQVQPTHSLHEAANSQHKSFMATPMGAGREVRNLDTNRDGFEIRDRSVEVDNHRFFEVVAN